jgi:ABC-type branched-subunit amino acid transport system substrate-binding protein
VAATARDAKQGFLRTSRSGPGRWAISAAAALLVVTACGTSGSSSGGGTSASGPGITKDTITLGAFLPLTGPASPNGVAEQKATNAYFSYINDKGGINGRKIKWIVYDDNFNPTQSLAVTKKLIEEDNVFFLANTLGVGPVLAVQPYLQQQGVPIVETQVQATPELVSPPKPNVYFTGIPVDQQAAFETNFLIDTKGCKNPGLIYQFQYSAGDAHKAGYEAVVKKRGLKAVETTYVPADSDYHQKVLDLQRGGADCIAGGGTSAGNAALGKALKDLGLSWSVAISTAQMDQNTIRLGGAAVEGFDGLTLTKPPTDTSDPNVKQYLETMAKYAPDYPSSSPIALFAYADAKLIVEILKLLGNNLTRENLNSVLANKVKNIDIGLLPPVSYTSTNHSGLDQGYVVEIKNGALTLAKGPVKMPKP